MELSEKIGKVVDVQLDKENKLDVEDALKEIRGWKGVFVLVDAPLAVLLHAVEMRLVEIQTRGYGLAED